MKFDNVLQDSSDKVKRLVNTRVDHCITVVIRCVVPGRVSRIVNYKFLTGSEKTYNTTLLVGVLNSDILRSEQNWKQLSKCYRENRLGIHYVIITGMTSFVQRFYLRCSKNPHESGRSILHCCWSTFVEKSTTSSPWLWTVTSRVSPVTENAFIWLKIAAPSDLF